MSKYPYTLAFFAMVLLMLLFAAFFMLLAFLIDHDLMIQGAVGYLVLMLIICLLIDRGNLREKNTDDKK